MWVESPVENESHGVVHHTLAKHEGEDVVVNVKVVEDGEHRH